MADLNVKVVIKSTGVRQRINVVPSGPLEKEAWDGDQQLILSKNGPEAQNLTKRLQELRNRPQLAAMSVPVSRSIQDTQILWSAWKESMLDILGQLYETKVIIQAQRLCDQDESTARHRFGDLLEQLDTTMASWRAQSKFLTDERVQLVALLNDRISSEKARLFELEEQDNTRPLYRVLRNAVRAFDITATERQQIWKKRADMDYSVHLQTFQGVLQGLNFYVETFVNDANLLKKQASALQQDIDNSIHVKQSTWAEYCQRQYNDYIINLHNPLASMITELDPRTTINQLFRETLNNENDPHCLRRCEVALMLLRQAQVRMLPASTSDQPEDADDALQHAWKERGAAEQKHSHQFSERWIALQSEYMQRDRAIQAATGRLQELETISKQIKSGLVTAFDAPSMDQKKLAVASRLAEQRLNQLREDMVHTAEAIKVERQQLADMAGKLSQADRTAVLQVVLEATHRVYQVCRTMRSRFEAATQSENMLRTMVHDQYMRGVRELQYICQDTIQQMVHVAQAHFGSVQVQLDRLQDLYSEAGRRIDTLHRGRIEQEERSSGDDIAIYRVIEEYADALTQKNAALEAVQKADFIKATAEGAIAFIQKVQQHQA
jgi:hypothetical protein